MASTALSREKIQTAIAAHSRDFGIMPEFWQIRPKLDVHVFESLPSTNTRLWQMMSQGAGAGTVAIAQQQSSGRGQRGRVWCSQPGGLYLSLALEPDWPTAHSAQLTCISAWGIATALNNLGVPIRIKWPNDLFFEGQKLGGILTETKLAQSTGDFRALPTQLNAATRIKQAVIGIGINWHNSVPETAITLSKILKLMPDSAASSKINCLEVLAALVLKGILQGYFFQQRVGSQVFMKAYSNLLTQVGEVVSLDNSLLDLAVFNGSAKTQPLLPLSQARQEGSPKESAKQTPLAKSPSDRKGTERTDVERTDVERSLKAQLVNRSGEIIGVSEEGYLKVALLEKVEGVSQKTSAETEEEAAKESVKKTATKGSTHRHPDGKQSAPSSPNDLHSDHLPGCVADILLLKPSETRVG
jgi:BirA family transcriptional regulator, biotin operon repressor / biotin---[acetyl-CoA-carboxylase] ligase